MDPEILIARLALARGWISPEVYRGVLDRSSTPGMVEDALRAAGLSAERIGTLRGALHIRRKEVWIGDWRLLRRIGIGGMGSVFEVRHRRTGRRAALKILLPRLGRDPEFTSRFLREAQALARISHPNVVHAYDAGQAGDFHFIAMELVDGEDLQRVLERERCLSPDRSAEVMLEVARALLAIQSAGLIHRDVKPANILIDPTGAVKLTDLGLFRDGTEREVLWDGMVFGTPQYMSPEQVLGNEEIDIRSDLYSLGATWYHALIGRPPFVGDSLKKVARAQVEVSPVPTRDIRPDVPLAIDRLILNLLAKEPACRPAGPEEVALSIERILASLGPPKRAPANGELAGKGQAGGREAVGTSRKVLLACGGLATVLAVALLAWAGRALFREGSREAGRAGSPVEVEAPAGELRAGEALTSAISAAGDLASLVEASSRRVLERTLPGIPGWLSRGVAGSPTPDLPSPPAVAPIPSMGAGIPPEVLEWAARGAEEARARLRSALSRWTESSPIEVVLRDGAVARARVTPSGPALVTEDGRSIPLDSLHPASAIACALDPEGLLPDWGIGLAISEGFLSGARLILKVASPSLPDGVRAFLAAGARDAMDAAPGVPEIHLERRLLESLEEGAARDRLRAGRFKEAEQAFAALLSRKDPSPQAEARRADWSTLMDRAGRLSYVAGRFFAPGASPLDPFRGDALLIKYDFQDGPELRDFRFEPSAWTLAEGSLLRAAPAGAGEKGRPAKAGGPPERRRPDFRSPLDTVALFAPPLTVKGSWSAPREMEGRIAVGFAGRFIALGPGSVLHRWRGELEDGRLPEAGGRAPAGAGGPGRVLRRFQVEFLEDSAIAEFPGGVRVPLSQEPAWPPALQPLGRIAIGLDPGSALEDLEITGTPDPLWAQVRIEEIKRQDRK